MFFLALICQLTSLSFADDLLEVLSDTLKSNPSATCVRELNTKYAGERVRGNGSITGIAKDIYGQYTVYISARASRYSNDLVNIGLVVKEIFNKDVPELKIGDDVFFIGEFKQIRMNTIFLCEGII